MKNLLFITSLFLSVNSFALVQGDLVDGYIITDESQVLTTSTTSPFLIPTLIVDAAADEMSEDQILNVIQAEVEAGNDDIAMAYAEALSERSGVDAIEIIASVLE